MHSESVGVPHLLYLKRKSCTALQHFRPQFCGLTLNYGYTCTACWHSILYDRKLMLLVKIKENKDLRYGWLDDVICCLALYVQKKNTLEISPKMD